MMIWNTKMWKTGSFYINLVIVDFVNMHHYHTSQLQFNFKMGYTIFIINDSQKNYDIFCHMQFCKKAK